MGDLAREMGDLAREMGDLAREMGDLAREMFAYNLWRCFVSLGESGYLHVELCTAIKRWAGLLKRLVAIYMFGYSQKWEPASTDMGG